jgi:hypothetical protein
MNIYEDFQEQQDEHQNNNFHQEGKNKKSKDKKNIFVYESFNERIKKIKVRLTNNLQNDISFMKVDEGDTFKYSDSESNFLTMMNREKVLNATPEFIQFAEQLKPYSGSFILMINNSAKLIKIFSDTLQTQLTSEGKVLDRVTENALNQRNYPFIQSVLEVLIGFVKDIREDASEVFLDSILPNLVALLTHSSNTEVIDKTFSVFVNIFKFLHKGIQKNFRKFFLIFSELIFHKNKAMRKFSCESICFLIKNLDKKELSDSLSIIFQVFEQPEIIFTQKEEQVQDSKMEISDEVSKLSFEEKMKENFISQKNFKNSKDFLYSVITNFNSDEQKVNLYMFIIDSISDLIFEILIGINKNLSIRADLILEKIASCFQDREKKTSSNKNYDDISYLKFMKDIAVIDAILKLYNYITDAQKKNVICLFHYYLYLNNSTNKKSITYPKLNLENLTHQLSYIDVNETLNMEIYTSLFIREFTIKFFDKIDGKTISYLLEFSKKILNKNNKNQSLINKLFSVELLAIFLKFYPEEFYSSYKLKECSSINSMSMEVESEISNIEILLTNFYHNENFDLLNNFLEMLKTLQNYSDFLGITFFDKRKNQYNIKMYHNDNYETSYNEEILTSIFENLLNNLKLQNQDQILNIITTYEYLMLDKTNVQVSSQDDSTKFLGLKLTHQDNKKLIINYLESIFNSPMDLEKNYSLENYMTLYTQIILINLIKSDGEKNLLAENYIENLISLMERNSEEDQTEQGLKKGLKNKNYFDVLFSEFNNENTYYLSKRHSLLNLLNYFTNVCPEYITNNKDRVVKLLKILLQERSLSHGVVYKNLNFIIDNYFGKNEEEFKKFVKSNFSFEFTSEFLTSTLKIFLNNNNSFKLEYLNFIKFIFFSHVENNSTSNITYTLVNDIFLNIESTLEIIFDFKNDKKYNFNFEVLMSKIENLLINEGDSVSSSTSVDKISLLNIYLITFYFLTGSYWIRFTKSVWSVLTKNIERFNEIINNLTKSFPTGPTAKFLVYLKLEINKQIEEMLNFIQTIGNSEDFISKYGATSQVLNNYYLTFKEKENSQVIHTSPDMTKINLNKNLISLTFLYKQDSMAGVSLLYEGYLQGLQSYSALLNSHEDIMRVFLNSIMKHLDSSAGNNTWLDDSVNSVINHNTSALSTLDNYYLCLFNNYVSDKEHKSGFLSKKFVEALLLVLSKCNLRSLKKSTKESENSFSILENKIKDILYRHIVISKSQQIQKYCVVILINLEDRLKPYKNLLEAVIENTNVIDRLYNLDGLKNDNNISAKQEERDILIPLVIRLYYSKYFYLSNENKKMRTKNKINLVSFFIQLKKNEFDEYVKIVFEPLSLALKNVDQIILSDDISSVENYFNSVFKFYNYDLRAYKKILEILTLNLKQITSLFEHSVCFISQFMTKILIFIKYLNSYIKSAESEEEFFNLFHESILNKTDLKNTRYISYFNKEGLQQYINFFQKNVKDIKKQTFILLKTVIIKFYHKTPLVSFLTKEICSKYKGDAESQSEYDFSTLSKPNSILEFFMSFARNPHLHFIYIENEGIFKKLLNIMHNKQLENLMLKSILDFLDQVLQPYNNLKIEIAREDFRRDREEKKEREEKLEKLRQEEMMIDQEAENFEEEEKSDQEEQSEHNSVIIEEMDLNEDPMEKMNIPELSKETLMRNEILLIKNNFSIINDNLLLLVKNKKVHFTIKDFNTRKVIEILVYLWNMFDESLTQTISEGSIKELVSFLVNLLKRDSKIFKYHNQSVLSDVLKVCHMLFKIYPSEKQVFYRDFILLLHKIQDSDSNNKLILTILLQEFSDYYSDPQNFSKILILLTELNLLKQKGGKKLTLDEGSSNLDVDNTIEKLNDVNLEFLEQFKFYHLEPLIYQLLIFSRSEDYSLQTISINKLKTIFESRKNIISLLQQDEATSQESFTLKTVLNTMYHMLSGEGKVINLNLSKTILEILSHINSLVETDESVTGIELLCHDLYHLKLKESEYNFFEAILNIKYEIRTEAMRVLKETLPENKLNYFSIIKVIIPLVKSVLSPYTYNKRQSIKGYNSFKLEGEVNKLINETIEVLPALCKILNPYDLKEFLLFFHGQIFRLNKKSLQGEAGAKTHSGPDQSGNVSVDSQTMLYKSLTRVIETVTKLYFTTKFDFDTQFEKTMRVMIEEYNNSNMSKLEETINKGKFSKEDDASFINRDLFKKVFEKLSIEYNKSRFDKFDRNSSDNQENENSNNYNYSPESKIELDILYLLKSDIYKTIKFILVDLKKKEKGRSYYLRNYAISPFLTLLKLLDPYQIKYELIQLNYELINNLKNRDLPVRERTREGLKIVFESMGVFISSMIFDELKTQLHSGYQRYIMGYTCNNLISIISRHEIENDVRLVFDFSSSLIMPMLLDELFGEVAEEKEIEQLVRKYKEAKQTKAFNSLFLLCSKIDLKNAIANVIYPLWSYLISRDNDIQDFNKLNECINHMIKGLKNNTSLKFDEILGYSNGLIKMGININLKNSKEILENKKVQMKGEDNEVKKKTKNFNQQRNELMTLQVGAINGKNYTMQIAEKFLNNKNEVVLSNMFTGLGLEIFLISVKKKLFNSHTEIAETESFGHFTEENKSSVIIENENITSLLQNVIACLEISNSNILSKSLKILTKLFDSKLMIIKKNLKRIVKHLFRNLNMINSQDITISQTILSSIGDILAKFKYTDISDNKLKVLLNFIKLNANNTQIKPYVYSCLLSIMKRKILHPSIYDMVNFIQENYLTAFDENTLILCQNILVEFLRNYPLEEARAVSHVNFFIINLESPTRKCVINSLKMIYRFFEVFYSEDKKDFMHGIVDFVILKLLTILTSSDDYEIKNLITANLEKIFSLIDEKKEEGYIMKVLTWLEKNNDNNLIRLSLNLLSILCNSEKNTINKRLTSIRDVLLNKINFEVNSFEEELEKKLENEDFESENKGGKELDRLFSKNQEDENSQSDGEDEEGNKIHNISKKKHDESNLTILNMKFDNWDILYLNLVVLEKLYKNYINTIKPKFKSNEFCILITKCLKHPHVFIKTIIMRFISYILKETASNNSSGSPLLNQSEFLFTNFKFFILNIDTNEKLSSLTIENSSLVLQQISKLSDTNLYNFSLEFICRLYVESKSFLSNKETSEIIFSRIFDLYDDMINTLSEKTLVNYLDPMLSLCYRVTANRLVDQELKDRTEKVLYI